MVNNQKTTIIPSLFPKNKNINVIDKTRSLRSKEETKNVIFKTSQQDCTSFNVVTPQGPTWKNRYYRGLLGIHRSSIFCWNISSACCNPLNYLFNVDRELILLLSFVQKKREFLSSVILQN